MRHLLSVMLLLFLVSCSTRGLIPGAISKGETINITVKHVGGAYAPVYSVVIQKQGEEYELIRNETSDRTIYKLPSNKLELLSQMEVSFKDLSKLSTKYFLVNISSGNKQKSYKINTDLIHDFISGLKKK